MSKIQRVLFICYANTCRSPGAEKMAQFYAKKYGLNGVTFDSAGWHNAFNYAQPETVQYVESKGIDMSTFRPKVITKDLLEKQDLIIGMERYHLKKVKNKFRDLKDFLKGKLFTLKEFNGAAKVDFNISDPYKTSPERYTQILNIVEEQVELLIKKICELNRSN